MNGRVCGALVQFGCYQYKHKQMSSSLINIRLSLEVTCILDYNSKHEHLEKATFNTRLLRMHATCMHHTWKMSQIHSGYMKHAYCMHVDVKFNVSARYQTCITNIHKKKSISIYHRSII